MKKFLSIAVVVLAFILVLSVNAFAADYEIEGLTVEDIYVTEGIDGYYDDDMKFNYYYSPDEFALDVTGDNIILGSDGCAFDGENYIYLWFSNVDTTVWTAGNTYTVDVGVDGSDVASTYKVHVESNGIESFEVYDVERVEGFNGYKNDNGDFIYSLTDIHIKVNYTDGTSEESWDGIYYRPDVMDYWLNLEYENDFQQKQAQAPWTAGNSYPVTVYLAGKSFTFNVNITEAPFTDVTVNDVEYIMGVDDSSAISSPSYTVYFKDGTSEDLDAGMSFMYGDQWFCLSGEDYEGELEVGDVITRTATLGKISKTYTVRCVENPVESVEIYDVELIEGKADYMDQYGNYYYGLYGLRAMVYYKDGSSEEIDTYLPIGNKKYYIEHNGSEMQENGTYWVLGGEYTVTGSLLGCTDTFKVSIVSLPIKKLEVDDLSMYANTNGDKGNGVFYYYINPHFTVTFNDESTEEGFNGVWIDDEWYNIEIIGLDQHETPLLPGNTYTATAKLGSITDTFNVTIKPIPIKKLEVNDIYIYEKTRGEFYDGVFEYYIELEGFTVTYLDDTTGYFEYGFELNNEYFSLDVQENQNTPWTVGTYTVEAELFGVADEFNVHILESPVQSIVVDDMDFIYGLDYRYGFSPSYTVYYKDGTSRFVESGDLAYIAEEYYAELMFEVPDGEFKVGDSYTIEASLAGASATFKLNVVDTPIKSIEIVQMPDKLTYIMYESFDPTGAILRINYKDNTYEDFRIEFYKSDEINTIPFYSSKLDREFDIHCWAMIDGVGKATATFYAFDIECNVDINVVENRMQSVSLSVDENKRIVITVTYTDNSTENMYFLGVDVRAGGDGVLQGAIITDKGVFAGGISYGDSFSLYLFNGLDESDVLRSNVLASCEWWNTYIYAYRFSTYPKFFSSYTGTVTKDNVDNIIGMAALMATYEDDFTSPGAVINGKYIKDIVKKYFDIDDFDLSLSTFYNAEKDEFDEENFTFEFNTDWIVEPFDIKYVNGEWVVVMTYYITEKGQTYTISIKLDDNYRIKEFVNNDPAICKNGWQFENDAWYYYENGIMVRNDWRQDSTGWCYLSSTGAMVTNGFVKDSVGLAYITESGYFYNTEYGWKFVNNKWYFVESGYAVTSNWRQDSTGWCYLSETGIMVTNGFVKDSIGLAYITENGYFYNTEYGWKLIDNKWYFVENGYAVLDQWRQDSMGWCYLGEDGAMLTNVWLKDSTGWCWLDESGYWDGIYYPTAAVTKNGWYFEEDNWYFYEIDVKVTNQWRADSKGWCYLSETGAMVTNGFVEDSVGLAYITEDGYFYYNTTGWKLVGDTWYFVENGYAVLDQWRQDSMGWCYLGEDGAMLTNVWLKDSVGWCWLDESGYWDGVYHQEPAA